LVHYSPKIHGGSEATKVLRLQLKDDLDLEQRFALSSLISCTQVVSFSPSNALASQYEPSKLTHSHTASRPMSALKPGTLNNFHLPTESFILQPCEIREKIYAVSIFS
jgi:hypothetical protein